MGAVRPFVTDASSRLSTHFVWKFSLGVGNVQKLSLKILEMWVELTLKLHCTGADNVFVGISVSECNFLLHCEENVCLSQPTIRIRLGQSVSTRTKPSSCWLREDL